VNAPHRLFAPRPWWMNALMLVCAYMAFVRVPMDLFTTPLLADEESTQHSDSPA